MMGVLKYLIVPFCIAVTCLFWIECLLRALLSKGIMI
jgi:hypothetical protein